MPGRAISAALEATSRRSTGARRRLTLPLVTRERVQQVRHEPVEMASLPLDHVHARGGPSGHLAAQQRGRRDDRRQRVTQLVPEHREEVVLRRVGGDRLVERGALAPHLLIASGGFGPVRLESPLPVDSRQDRSDARAHMLHKPELAMRERPRSQRHEQRAEGALSADSRSVVKGNLQSKQIGLVRSS